MSPSFIQHFLHFELCLQPVVRFYYLGLLIQVSFNRCLHDALICFSRNALRGNFGEIFSCCNRTFFILWFCCLLYLQRAASPKWMLWLILNVCILGRNPSRLLLYVVVGGCWRAQKPEETSRVYPVSSPILQCVSWVPVFCNFPAYWKRV